MSNRLGAALADHLREHTAGSAAFVLVEGVPAEVARGMSDSWDDAAMPRLAIVARNRAAGRHALAEASGTQLRNEAGDRGVVLVLCDGEQLPDRQSLNLFESVSPGVLLDDATGLARLSRQAPSLDLDDGWARAVRVAIVQRGLAERPSPAAVAAYLDRLAEGGDPLAELPILGAFADRAPAGERADSSRIVNNFELASRRTSEDILRPASVADLRKRAEQILRNRRPAPADPAALAADLAADLQRGSDAFLAKVTYDEARELLDRRPKDLAEIVRAELSKFRADVPPGSQDEGLPWDTYFARADELGRSARQRDAARELADFDDAHQRRVFEKPTRRKLERSLVDRAVDGSSPSCPEAAVVRAAEQLNSLVHRVELLEPKDAGPRNSRSSAGRVVTLACTRLRLGGLFRRWHDEDEDVDGRLLRSVDDDDLHGAQGVLDALDDLDLGRSGSLPVLKLRLHAEDSERTTVQVTWRPDLDDVALLRAALRFAEQPCLTLTADSEPSLRAFCSRQHLTPKPAPASLSGLAGALRDTALRALESGLTPALLLGWVQAWTAAVDGLRTAGDVAGAEAAALAGTVQTSRSTALTAFAPMKAEWLAQHLEALWELLGAAEDGVYGERGDSASAAAAVARTTATHHPAHLRLRNTDRPLLPTSEARVWSVYGADDGRDESGYAGESLHAVLTQLLMLQPEAAGHLRCLAWGPGAADLLAGEAVRLLGNKVGSATVERVEIFCVGTGEQDKPRRATLDLADDKLRGERDALQLRYMDDLPAARRVLAPAPDSPAVHFALVTGITQGGRLLTISSAEVDRPALDPEVLFAPRVWQRPDKDRRVLLMPPAASEAGQAWLSLQHTLAESQWPGEGEQIDVPEVRTGTFDITDQLIEIHELALWVATLDRYATRDSLEQALGRDKVAILHQERRLGGESPLALVLSQKSGGPADRAIGRSLRAAQIVRDPDVALSIGTELRKVASQGYGILALQAATSGAGINELVGHVVAFSMLAHKTTPWPLPPGCRVLLVSLDEYRHWFRGKRADLLAIALDPAERGVHVAAIEVKARRSDEKNAAAEALNQLQQTNAATRWAAQPDGSIHSRLWLNRIAEAAYSVARESRFRLDAGELAALEEFRLGRGSLEWAGVGLVFGPHVVADAFTRHDPVGSDIVPVVLHSVTLTEELLRQATGTDLTTLRTAEAERAPLQSTRIRRRPETKQEQPATEPGPDPQVPDAAEESADTTFDGNKPAEQDPTAGGDTTTHESGGSAAPAAQDTKTGTPDAQKEAGDPTVPATAFSAPVLGWDDSSGEAVSWHPAGPGQDLLQNGHIEIWGSSGMGKTQFVMSLLAQLIRHTGSRVGILDFKNDYSDDTGFPSFGDAEFIDLWDKGAKYNPLALSGDSGPRDIQAAVIELRDAIEEATRAFTRMGVRQKRSLQSALEAAYRIGAEEGRWPTLKTLGDQFGEDLGGVLGDLTSYELFKAGDPLGEVINRNVVFGLSKIPGNGQTTVFAAGFILSALLLRVQNLPPVPNTIRYVTVVDEAHRVASFKAIATMLREGRSKGLSVVLATQQPLDLPDIVGANAQTKICFGLPDATAATMAARKLDPHNSQLPGQIRTLGVGEAYVSFSGRAPQLLRMAQAHRDASRLGLPPLEHPR